ncbi:ABC-2 type transporter family protein [Perilla frutescens var. hirtella]|nr:ABC-2 type transporter family protein [Perilla frutescens var. frutescens]KAH6800792.1 ABC-2 type transporter family protein [Perilla frutescens var. hirtella]
MYWIWFHYISLVKYPYEAVLQNEFADPVKCFGRGVQNFDGTPMAAVPEKLLNSMSNILGMKITGTTCVTIDADIMRQQSVEDLSKWNCLWVTVALWI